MEKTLKGSANQALANRNSTRKRKTRENRLKFFGYDCLFSFHSYNRKDSARWKEKQIDEGKKKFLKNGKRNCVIRFGWWSECNDMVRLKLKGNTISLSDSRAGDTDRASSSLLEERLQPSGHIFALDAYYMFLDYTPCGNESDIVKGSIARLA